MPYQILYERAAEKELQRVERKFLPPIRKAIESLAESPRPYGSIKLENSEYLRIRVGNFRIIYSVIDKLLIVRIIRVMDRKEAYKTR